MSRTYHSKKAFKQKMERIRLKREEHAAESGATVLSTLNQQCEGWQKARKRLSRHPYGTKASGLRRELRGKGRINDDRDRFGAADQQSSRMRRMRKAGNHAFRLKSKEEVRAIVEDLEESE